MRNEVHHGECSPVTSTSRFVLACSVFPLLLTLHACDSSSAGNPTDLRKGYPQMDRSLIEYSAREQLGSAGQTVYIVGLTGLLGFPGEEGWPGANLQAINYITGASPESIVLGRNGDFVIAVPAAAGETIDVLYESDEINREISIDLQDDLSGVPAPVLQTGASLLADDPREDIVIVDIPRLDSPAVPIVIFNADDGSATQLADSQYGASMYGRSGELFCVFSLGPDDKRGPSLCATVP